MAAALLLGLPASLSDLKPALQAELSLIAADHPGLAFGLGWSGAGATLSLAAGNVTVPGQASRPARADDRFLFGSGTNIFSILADPELESTWERVKLKQASLVVACLVQRDSERMCHYMKDSKVPVMSVCSDNGEAARLYRAGCTYALQQDFVAAKEFLSLLRAERVAGANDDFKDRSLDHQDQLTEESHDAVLKLISAFI